MKLFTLLIVILNDRIIEWKPNATEGRIVAGGNGRGKGTAQLNRPTNVIIDRENNALIMNKSSFRISNVADWQCITMVLFMFLIARRMK